MRTERTLRECEVMKVGQEVAEAVAPDKEELEPRLEPVNREQLVLAPWMSSR